MNKDSRVRLGEQKEELAAHFVTDLGYTIITRNYKIKGGEIDIVAMDGSILVFLEVRYRHNTNPEESVAVKKTKSVVFAAQEYMRRAEQTSLPFRIDLIAIQEEEIRHYKGGIYADSWDEDSQEQPETGDEYEADA